MMLDFVLACLHHVLVFALFGLLAAELALVRPGLDARGLAILGRIDGAYGATALAVLGVGICRVLYGLKGWDTYSVSPGFALKMTAFVAVGLISIQPTRAILRWRRANREQETAIAPAEIAAVRRMLYLQAAGFVLIVICAAAMARGIGD